MEVIGVVKYYLKRNFYVVGDNKTSKSGITNTSFSGDIIIPEVMKGRRIKEIVANAFRECHY